jgi:hypothetical protein
MATGTKILSVSVVGLALGFASDMVARGAAQLRAGHDIDLLFPNNVSTAVLLLPILFVAAGTAHAEAFHSRRAVVLVWVLALPPYVFWTYQGVFSSLRGLDLHRWTASGLSAGLAWFASLLCVLVAIPTALFFAPRLERLWPWRDKPAG